MKELFYDRKVKKIKCKNKDCNKSICYVDGRFRI